MKILVTGHNGFIGRNLVTRLGETERFEVVCFGRESTVKDLQKLIHDVDFICHLAGVNRPDNDNEFSRINVGFTSELCAIAEAANKPIPIIFSSSVHVEKNNEYGKSKFAAENILIEYGKKTGSPVHIFRLPHVIGKWCQPNYNSVVATFCYNISRGMPIQINDPDYALEIVYIDDLIDTFVAIILGKMQAELYCKTAKSYLTTVGELAKQLRAFHESRSTLITEHVGEGLTRALYATYTSYLSPDDFSYKLKQHKDSRGSFVEVLKTKESGQFSFFTAHPGITRGGHYHHTKTEKFLVIKGTARFCFRHLITKEYFEIITSGESPEIVETIPGWIHDITNIGDEQLLVMLWANEIFNPEKPDTISQKMRHE